MILKIDRQVTAGDLTDKFSRCFPHLRLLFYPDAVAKKLEKPARDNTPLHTLRRNQEPALLELKSWLRVKEVTELLHHQYGLIASIEVCRNGAWEKAATGQTLGDGSAVLVTPNKAPESEPGDDEEEVRMEL